MHKQFFFAGKYIDKIEKNKIIKTKYIGIYDVAEVLPEIKLIIMPHKTKKIP